MQGGPTFHVQIQSSQCIRPIKFRGQEIFLKPRPKLKFVAPTWQQFLLLKGISQVVKYEYHQFSDNPIRIQKREKTANDINTFYTTDGKSTRIVPYNRKEIRCRPLGRQRSLRCSQKTFLLPSRKLSLPSSFLDEPQHKTST